MSTAKVSLDVLIFVLLAEMRKQDKEVSQDEKKNTELKFPITCTSSSLSRITNSISVVFSGRILKKVVLESTAPLARRVPVT